MSSLPDGRKYGRLMLYLLYIHSFRISVGDLQASTIAQRRHSDITIIGIHHMGYILLLDGRRTQPVNPQRSSPGREQ